MSKGYVLRVSDQKVIGFLSCSLTFRVNIIGRTKSLESFDFRSNLNLRLIRVLEVSVVSLKWEGLPVELRCRFSMGYQHLFIGHISEK